MWMAPNSAFQLSQVKDGHFDMESTDGNKMNDKLKLSLDTIEVLVADIKANTGLQNYPIPGVLCFNKEQFFPLGNFQSESTDGGLDCLCST